MSVVTRFPLENVSTPTPSTAHLRQTHWGYIVRSEDAVRSTAALMQGLSGFAGFTMVLAALGFWLLPGSLIDPEVAAMKYLVSGGMVLLGVVFLWYGAQGTDCELQVDLTNCELREAVRNSKGHVRMVARFMFEEIDAVFIDRSMKNKNKRSLMLRFKGPSRGIEVARGNEADLSVLRDRLGRDILAGAVTDPRRRSGSGGEVLRLTSRHMRRSRLAVQN